MTIFRMKRITFCLLMLTWSAGIITSCKDNFTEEDILKEQQTIDLNVLAFDPNTGSAIPNARVMITANGKLDSARTNESGLAIFEDVKIGTSVPVTVEADGYTSAKSLEDLTVEDFRQGQITVTKNLFSLTGPSTAQVRGKIEIQTDLTNETAEKAPEGTIITASVNTSSYEEISVSTKIDADGNYTFTLPTSKQGWTYKLSFPDLELDQKIAINRLASEEAFPITAPSIQNIKTVFATSETAISIPEVNPVYVTVNGGTSPARLEITPDDIIDGKISTGAYGFFGARRGSGYTAGAIPASSVEFTSLAGETTKATATANADADGKITFIDVTAGGEGYPYLWNANQTPKTNPSFSNTLTVESGDIKILNFNYGTGTSRAQEVK